MKGTKRTLSEKTFGDRIMFLRHKAGDLTQAELAKALHTSREIVVKWEGSDGQISAQYVLAIADYFGVSTDYLLRGTEPENFDFHKATGLSNAAFNILSYFRKNEQDGLDQSDHIKALDTFIANGSFLNLLIAITRYSPHEPVELYYKTDKAIIKADDSESLLYRQFCLKDAMDFHLQEVLKELEPQKGGK